MDKSVISFINMKGGVGKTTLCINIAYTLAKHFQKKVLIVDIDPQFNATQSLITKFSTFSDYEEIQEQGKTINYILQKPTGGFSKEPQEYEDNDVILGLIEFEDGLIDLVPGDLEIVSFESSRRGSERILEDFLRERIPSVKEYDYIFIDTPATYSIYSQSALLASDFFVVPISPDVFAALGYSLLQRVMGDDIALKGKEIQELGIIFTLYKEGKIGRETIKEHFAEKTVFENSLPEYERIRTGRMETFIYDMELTKKYIVDITQELINKIDEITKGEG